MTFASLVNHGMMKIYRAILFKMEGIANPTDLFFFPPNSRVQWWFGLLNQERELSLDAWEYVHRITCTQKGLALFVWGLECITYESMTCELLEWEKSMTNVLSSLLLYILGEKETWFFLILYFFHKYFLQLEGDKK